MKTTDQRSAFAPRSLFHPIAIIFTGVLVGGALSGCGNAGPELGRVEGVVTLNGEPLPEAFVFFKHNDGGRIARAVTDESGRYVLNFNNQNSGAIVGPNTVRISTLVEPVKDDYGKVIPGTGKKERVPKGYNRETTLKADVQSGKNVIDFPLTSDGTAMN